MTEHTPGPYIVGKPGGPAGPFWSLVNQQGTIVAMQIVNEADAYFLRAAPEMLAALRFARSVILSGEPWTEQCEAVIGSAIYKATRRNNG